MPTALFIAYDFPPCQNIGGSLRSAKFAKYLPQFGWHVTILSLFNANEASPELYPHVKRIPSRTLWARPYQVTPYGWIPPLYQEARKHLRQQSWDIMYVSCPPFPHTLAPWRLKRRFGIPLVLDFRDAWSLDPYVEGSLLKKLVARTLFPAIERIVVKSADALILNTPSTITSYLTQYPQLRHRMVMIPNGYDEEDFIDFSTEAPKNKMKLLYCGRFGIGDRDPLLLLKALKEVTHRRLCIELRIIGRYQSDLPRKICELGLQEHVKLDGEYPHQEAIHAMGDCSVLVVYQEHSDSLLTPVAGKTYEYLRTGKPLLALAPPGDNIDLIVKYAKRYECVTDFNSHSVAKAIELLYTDWKKGLLNQVHFPHIAYLDNYSRSSLTSRLDSLFRDILNNYSCSPSQVRSIKGMAEP